MGSPKPPFLGQQMIHGKLKQRSISRKARFNYEPHSIAGNLPVADQDISSVSHTPRTIADPFFLEYLNGVSSILFEHGYSMLCPR